MCPRIPWIISLDSTFALDSAQLTTQVCNESARFDHDWQLNWQLNSTLSRQRQLVCSLVINHIKETTHGYQSLERNWNPLYIRVKLCITVESLYTGHHWEPTFCPLMWGVPNTGVSGRRGMHNWAVEHNVTVFLRAFPWCTLAAKTKQRLVLQLLI